MKNKEIISLFKSSVKEVSEVLGVEPHLVKRDEYVKVAIENDIARLNKVRLNELGGFAAALALYFPTPQKTKAEIEEEQRQEIVINYSGYLSAYGITPSIAIIQSWGFSSAKINKLFGSMRKLYDKCSDEYSRSF
jgi:hypothetical protein